MNSCLHCHEPVLPTEPQETVRLLTREGLQLHLAHEECAARAVLGSVAHQQHRCGCFVSGSTAIDVPALTPRQAAAAALAYARSKGGPGG